MALENYNELLKRYKLANDLLSLSDVTDEMINLTGKKLFGIDNYKLFAQLNERAIQEINNIVFTDAKGMKNVVELITNDYKLYNNQLRLVTEDCNFSVNKLRVEARLSVSTFFIWFEENVLSLKENKHPFTNQEAYDVFNYLNEWVKPADKVKYSYIYDFIKENIDKNLHEKSYFEYVIELTGLNMSKRTQATALKQDKRDLVKAKYQDYLKVNKE